MSGCKVYFDRPMTDIVRMDKRPVLFALTNPYSDVPGLALSPDPPGCSGWKLWMLLRDRVPEVTRTDYLDAFDRRNLLPRDVPMAEAGMWGNALMKFVKTGVSDLPGRTVVVFGSVARDALGLEPCLIHPVEKHGVVWRQLPHPSGRCLWYNDPTHRLLASLLLEDLYEIGRDAHGQRREAGRGHATA